MDKPPAAPASPPSPPPLALRLPEVVEATGIGERKLRAMVKANSIPHARIGKRMLVFPWLELQQWLSKQVGWKP